MGLPQRGPHVVGPELHQQVAFVDGRLLTDGHVDDRAEHLRADGHLGAGIGDDPPLGGDPAGRSDVRTTAADRDDFRPEP